MYVYVCGLLLASHPGSTPSYTHVHVASLTAMHVHTGKLEKLPIGWTYMYDDAQSNCVKC